MARLAGIKLHKTATGKVKAVTVDIKRWGVYIEDLLDIIDAERHRHESTVPWEEVRKKLNKKHGLKD